MALLCSSQDNSSTPPENSNGKPVPALSFETKIASLDPSCPLTAIVHTEKYYEGKTLTPDEAKAEGIDLRTVPDYASNQTLGEQMANTKRLTEYLTQNPSQIYLSEDGIHTPNDIIPLNYAIQKIVMNATMEQGLNIICTDKISTYSGVPMARIESQSTPVAVPNQNIPIYKAEREPVVEGVFKDLRSNCIHYTDSKGHDHPLCNFDILPLCREIYIGKNGTQIKLNYLLQLIFPDNAPINLRITDADLNNITEAIRKTADAAVISSEAKSPNQKLSNYIRNLLPHMHENDHYILMHNGWQIINGRHFYIYDNHPPIIPYSFDTGKFLYRRNPLPKEHIWCYLNKMLCISNNFEVGGFAVTYSFMGILYSLFKDAGYQLNFTLNIIGTTGSLKTELSKVLFLIFNRDKEVLLHSFTDTPTSHELYIASLCDEVGLIDDLEFGDSFQESNRQRGAYNDIIRKVGDGKGKNRSNAKLDNVLGDVTKGLLAITGEQTIGKQSTRLRTAEIDIAPNSINGKILEIFQKDPGIWPSIIAFFIDYLENHYDTVVNQIRSSYSSMRDSLIHNLSAKRYIAQIVAFQITIDIVENFVINYCGNDASIVQPTFNAMRSSIMTRYGNLNMDADAVNPGIQFILDVDILLSTNKIAVAHSKEDYQNSTSASFIGYEDGDSLLLLSDDIYIAVKHYEDTLRRYFPFSNKKCFKSMAELGIIEQFSNGCNATTNTTKILQGSKRQTAIKINRLKMEDFVEKYSQQ